MSTWPMNKQPENGWLKVISEGLGNEDIVLFPRAQTAAADGLKGGPIMGQTNNFPIPLRYL